MLSLIFVWYKNSTLKPFSLIIHIIHTYIIHTPYTSIEVGKSIDQWISLLIFVNFFGYQSCLCTEKNICSALLSSFKCLHSALYNFLKGFLKYIFILVKKKSYGYYCVITILIFFYLHCKLICLYFRRTASHRVWFCVALDCN